MPSSTKFPGATIKGPGARPPLAAKVLEAVNPLVGGPVLLLEFGNPLSPVTAVPADGATVPDLSDIYSKVTNGGTSFGPLPVTNNIGVGSVKTKAEMTSRRELHVMSTQLNHPGVSPYETLRVLLGGGRVTYLNNAILAGHPIFVGSYWRDTRVPAASFTDAEMFAGLSRGEPSGALATTLSNRFATIGMTNAQTSQGPLSGNVLRVNSTAQRDGSGPGSYTFCAGVTAQATAFGTTSAGLSTGAAITSLPVAALTAQVPNGTTVTVKSGANTQTFTVTATAAIGATALAVTSATPNFAYPSGSTLTVAFTVQDRILSLGEAASTFANKLGSRAIGQIYVEDLALTGRTHDAVYAAFLQGYKDQMLDPSGRYFGEVAGTDYSVPATALP